MLKVFLVITMLVTGYCDDSCGKHVDHLAYGITASGLPTHTNVLACPPQLEFGTIVLMGGEVFVCADRGFAIKGYRLDRWFPTCEEALEWGIQEREVWIFGAWNQSE